MTSASHAEDPEFDPRRPLLYSNGPIDHRAWWIGRLMHSGVFGASGARSTVFADTVVGAHPTRLRRQSRPKVIPCQAPNQAVQYRSCGAPLKSELGGKLVCQCVNSAFRIRWFEYLAKDSRAYHDLKTAPYTHRVPLDVSLDFCLAKFVGDPSSSVWDRMTLIPILDASVSRNLEHTCMALPFISCFTVLFDSVRDLEGR